MMRVLVVGHREMMYLPTGFCLPWSNEAREVYVAKEIARRGHDVTLCSTANSGTSDGLLAFQPWSEVDVATFDAVLVFDANRLRVVQDRLRAHPRVVLATDHEPRPEDDVGYLAAAGISTCFKLVTFREAYPSVPSFLWPWACPEVGEYADPWPEQATGRRCIYVGTMLPRYMETLNALAERADLEVWAGGVWADNVAGIGWGGMTDAQRAEFFSPRVRLLTDVVGLRHEKHLGPLMYEEQFPFYRHADVGLSLTKVPWLHMPNCKVYDMLAAGLYVVSETGSTSSAEAVAIGAGEVVRHGDTAALIRAVIDAPPRSRQTEVFAKEAFGTWGDRAEILLRFLS